MKKILVTYHANQELDYEQVVFERLEFYAKKCNAKFIKVDLSEEVKNSNHPQKYSLEKYFKINELKEEEFDRALIIDTDVMVRKDSPDIFELSENKLCVFNEGCSFINYKEPNREIEEIQKRYANIYELIKECKLESLELPKTIGFKEGCFEYFNFGVQVLSKSHLNIFDVNEDLKEKLRSCAVYGPDQAYFNYLIQKEKIETYSLPNCFNQMISTFKYNYLDTSYFVHYAGFADQRMKFVEEDNKIWEKRGI